MVYVEVFCWTAFSGLGCSLEVVLWEEFRSMGVGRSWCFSRESYGR